MISPVFIHPLSDCHQYSVFPNKKLSTFFENTQSRYALTAN